MVGFEFNKVPKRKRTLSIGPKWNRPNEDDLNWEGVGANDVSANAQNTETVGTQAISDGGQAISDGGQPKTVVLNGADYRANAPYNSVDYAREYLGGNGNGMSAEEMRESAVVNHENPVVRSMENPGVRSADMVDENAVIDKDASNTDWMRAQGLVDENDMQAEYDEYMKNAPEYISEEEQRKRLRASQSSKAVADLGSIASAFANLYGVGRGAMNQQVAYAQAPDYQALVDKWQAQRNNYRSYAQKGRDYVYNRRRQELLDEYTREKNDIDLQYRQAQIELSKARESAVQQQNAIKLQEIERKAREAEEKHNLELLKLNETKRKNDATIALGYARLAEDRRNHNLVNSRVTSKNSGSNSNWHVANASGMSVDVPKANINDHNRGELLKLCGSDGYKETPTSDIDIEAMKRVNGNKKASDPNYQIIYKKKREKMTKDEMWNFIVNHINPKAERYIVEQMGGSVYGGPSEEAKENAPKENPAPIYKTKDGKTFTDGNEYLKHLKELEEQEKKAKANGGVSANAQNTGTESGGAPKADAQKGNAPKASAPKTDAKASGSGASAQKGKTASGSGKKASKKVEVAKTVDGKNYDEDGKEIIEW